jgi:hypothetical protein
MRLGDVQTFLMHVCPTRPSSAPLSLGKLLLRWRRAPSGATEAAPLSALPGGESALAAGAAGSQGDAVEDQAPPGDVLTALELPRVTVVDSLITARVTSPAQVTAGIAFPYTLHVGVPGGGEWRGGARGLVGH